MKKADILALLLSACLLVPLPARSGQWVSPKEALGDPNLARLQNGRKELTPAEKEEVARYSYTGLEIMTYVDDNKDPGQDWDAFERYLHVAADGNLRSELFLRKIKYGYRDQRALLAPEGIRPGEIEYREMGVSLYPPKWRHSGWLAYIYHRAPGAKTKYKDEWWYDNDLRRNRRIAFTSQQDAWFGTTFTFDDYTFREPWEEEHRILGEDIFRGRPCFVVESRNRVDPSYYLSRRVSWVEKERFLDLHEEQFDREGRLQKVIDREWVQVKPWNYWVQGQQDYVDLGSKTRTVLQNFGWNFDQGRKDGEFLPGVLRREHIWKLPPKELSPLRNVTDLPPKPKVSWDFWKRMGVELKGSKEGGQYSQAGVER